MHHFVIKIMNFVKSHLFELYSPTFCSKILTCFFYVKLIFSLISKKIWKKTFLEDVLDVKHMLF